MPVEQTAPEPQELPQAPQLEALVRRSAQVPLQLVCPFGQHTPLEQLDPAEHPT
jgi:hypothetical protein